MPHLDRPFDYAVPDDLVGVVKVGTRVRVRFAGRLVNAVVIALGDASTFEGTLAPINSAAGVPSFTPRAIELAQSMARRYGGSLWDVLRLMAPPRVASLETRDWSTVELDLTPYRDARDALATLDAPALDVDALAAGARVVWQALPEASRTSGTPARALVAPAVAVAALDQTSIVIVPDTRALKAVEAALAEVGLKRWTARSGGHVAFLDADDGANARYAAYLAAMHGHVRLVAGTRPVSLQPVPELGFIAIWDEGSPNFDDPHAPYYNARAVAAMRADFMGAGMLLAAYSPSIEALALVEHGWAEAAMPSRVQVREAAPAIEAISDHKRDAEGASGWHWMPGSVWRAVREAVAAGPVAIVVPRAGYVRAVACARCGEWAACLTCGGMLRQDHVTAPLTCRDCGREQPDWHCAACNGRRIKQVRQGVERIAEQVAAMAPGVQVHVSSGATGVIADGAVEHGIVVATPGAVPSVAGGYSYAVVVGADAPASGGLGAEAKAVRWWLGVGALVRDRGHGGRMALVGALPDQARRALETWDPMSASQDALAERTELGLPPARRTIRLTGNAAAITLALSVSVEGERIERHREVSVTALKDGALLLVSRRAAQSVIDTLRTREIELSRQGQDTFRMRVDGPVEL